MLQIYGHLKLLALLVYSLSVLWF